MRWIIYTISLLLIGGMLVHWPRPAPPPPSYRAAVIEVLVRHNLSFEDVAITDGCAPSYQHCRSYAGAVAIDAADEIQGTIRCTARWTGCVLDMPVIGVEAEPLRDIVVETWMDRVRALWLAATAHLRL